MKICLITDTHVDVKSGAQQILDSQIRAFHEMFEFMKQNDIKHIWHLGDITDNRKHISLNSLHHLQHDIFDKLEEYDFKMDYLVGNHDIYHKDTLEINSMKLFAKAYPRHFQLHEKPITKTFDVVKVQFVPWIIDQTTIDDEADVILCHAELKDFFVVRGHRSTHGLDRSIFKDKLVFSGHYHIGQSEGKIKYLGNSFIQQDWGDFKEKKGFWVFDTNDMSIVFHESKATPKHVKCHINADDKTVVVQGLFDIDEGFKLDAKFKYDMFKGHKLKVYATKELAIVKKFIESIEGIVYSWKLEIMIESEDIDISERIEKAKDYSIDDKIIAVCDEDDKDLVVSIIQEAKGLMKEAV